VLVSFICNYFSSCLKPKVQDFPEPAFHQNGAISPQNSKSESLSFTPVLNGSPIGSPNHSPVSLISRVLPSEENTLLSAATAAIATEILNNQNMDFL
jgi:hypothetical protein